MKKTSILILADIHSNREALEAVLTDADPAPDTTLLCLGDVVGYGPDPQACIDILRRHDARVLAGNHDAAVVGDVSPELFNFAAREAVEWTRKQLINDCTAFLEELPERINLRDIYAVHGSPQDPYMEYVTSPLQAHDVCRDVDKPMLAVGHTHQPVCFRPTAGSDYEAVTVRDGRTVNFSGNEQEPFLVNPGSVGQPRDGNPDASYLIYDPEDRVLTWHRTPYAIGKVQEKIRNAGLPEMLAARLERGQ